MANLVGNASDTRMELPSLTLCMEVVGGEVKMHQHKLEGTCIVVFQLDDLLVAFREIRAVPEKLLKVLRSVAEDRFVTVDLAFGEFDRNIRVVLLSVQLLEESHHISLRLRGGRASRHVGDWWVVSVLVNRW